MFDSKEIIAQRALRRADEIKTQKKRKRKWLKIAAPLTVCFGLAVCLALLPGRYAGISPISAQGDMGSLLDGANMGGYTLVGIIGFCIGVSVTLLINHQKRIRDTKQTKAEGQ